MPEAVFETRGHWDSRKAAELVALARTFSSDVRLTRDAVTADGKDLPGLLALGQGSGTEALLLVEGKDEKEAFAALVGRFADLVRTENWCSRFFDLIRNLALVPEPVARRVWSRLRYELDRRREKEAVAGLMRQDRASGNTRRKVEMPFRRQATGSSLCRPALIICHMVQRLRRRLNCTWDIARRRLAERARLTPEEVAAIERGSWPTPAQLDNLERHLKWTLFFLFGESEQAYTDLQTAYFERLHNLSPTEEDRRAFRQLYARLLRRRCEREDCNKSGPDTQTGK